ncbi:hypothetical protein SAMN05660484_00242 [Eubacterium ruminantium]|jgi:hypothetical protein|uniref:Uncharacterized protein n=1 Tax=Eubacterium ruminantium TaxID=42322 RepID=A0A1T4K275_9FIRM|nr:hypothetical protein [Eubacterium ruminantium]SCW28376.1 hypothetical protein SAMN05660484_00242 [Eubacterium ruminantium]SDM11806.1 hypothetical protein SAMN04490370_101100 [Eubacterium ruminantium]SJZ36405.1 hypothetical protein SAMN02745110_00100 [Eubacterium ruminantium]
MSGNIIIDNRLLKAYDRLSDISKYTGKSKEYTEKLWEILISDHELMEEFVFYLDNHTFMDKYKVKGYGMIDLYFLNIRYVEMQQDVGKNYSDTDKDALALDTFMMMADMKKNPEIYIKKLEEGPGMDRFM